MEEVKVLIEKAIGCLEQDDIDGAISKLDEATDFIDDNEDPELTQIPNSTIQWDADTGNINFTDREIMELLEKLYQQHPAQTILAHLEKMANGL